jgi:hypothetical protein
VLDDRSRRGSADVNTHHVSASQVGTRKDCARRWAFSRFYRPSNRYADFGTKVHEHKDAWIERRIPPPDTPEGRCLLAGLGDLPAPMAHDCETCRGWWVDPTSGKIVRIPASGSWACPTHGAARVRAEVPIDFDDVDGTRWVGSADIVEQVDHVTLRVVDLKTCGDLRFALEPNHRDPDLDLVLDLQRCVYAHALFLAFPHVRTIVCQWEYLPRSGKGATPRVFVDDRQGAAARFEAARILAREVAELWSVPFASIPRTLTSCGKYGGCPFSSFCLRDVEPAEIARAFMRDADRRAALRAPKDSPNGGA